MTPNEQAFLDLIALSEGTYGRGDNGYDILCGGGMFYSYADHPRQKIYIAKYDLFSTAAGRYQVIAKTYDYCKSKLDLPDFSPASQDQIALELIKEHDALDDVEARNMESAVTKCAKIWASFPGAGYGQLERSMDKLRILYDNLLNHINT